MEYVGEHLFPGQLGKFAIVLGFVASIMAAVAYYFATQRRANEEEALGWRKIGRASFLVHGLSFFTVIGILFYIMINQYYDMSMYGYMFPMNYPLNISFLPFGKHKKVVSYCGCFGILS